MRAAELLLALIFPRRCPWCGAVQGFAPACRCAPQVQALRLPAGPLAQPLPRRYARAAYAALRYEEPVRGAILRMKFEDEPGLAEPFAEELARHYAACGLAGRYDVAAAVPVSRKTLRRRGYNQSAMLAGHLARGCGLPLAGALRKVRETAPQRTLGREGRLTNVDGAYEADAAQVAGRRVLLIDDIYTTGSTVNECAKTLLAAGAAECGVLCLAAADAQPEAGAQG